MVKAERKRKTPDPATWTKHLVGKPLPDMERLGKKIKKLLEEVHRIELCQKVNVQAAQIQYVNSVIMGMAQYLQTSICSRAYHAIDRRVNNAALAVWKKLYPKRYNSMQVSLKVLCNLPDRHKGYDSKTFAVWVEGKWFGITYAFITHSHYILKAERRCQYEIRSKSSPVSCGSPECISGTDAEMDAEPVGVCAGTAHAVYFRLRPLYTVLPGVDAVFDLAGGGVWLLPAPHRRNGHCRSRGMVQRLDCRIIKFLCRHCAAFSFCREVVKLAATRLIALHKNKGKSVAACLKSRTDYAQNPDKTQQGELVSSYECSPLTVDEEFMLSKRQYELVTGRRQKSDVIAYQIRQSFKPGEITAEEANKVGYGVCSLGKAI